MILIERSFCCVAETVQLVERSSDALKIGFVFGELLVLNFGDNVVGFKVKTRRFSNLSDLIMRLCCEKLLLLKKKRLAFFDLL